MGELGWLGKGNSFAHVGEILPYERTLTLSKLRAGSEMPTVECGGKNWVCPHAFSLPFPFFLPFLSPCLPACLPASSCASTFVSKSMVHEPAVMASPRGLVEMQNLGCHPKASELDLHFNKIPRS